MTRLYVGTPRMHWTDIILMNMCQWEGSFSFVNIQVVGSFVAARYSKFLFISQHYEYSLMFLTNRKHIK
jgi:hypothetical protein